MLGLLVLFAYPVYCLILSQTMPVRRAFLTALISGWLLLPHIRKPLPGLPDYDRSSAVVLGMLLITGAFGFSRFKLPRLRWVDGFVIVLTLVPIGTAVTNGLGLWEGLSYALANTVRFLIPYAIGRIYFSDEEGALMLVKAIFIGGLIYIPFVLFEKRFSPQIHSMVYGFSHFRFDQAIRGGGYRPVVFLQHGLATALWMAAAATSGVVLKRAGLLKPLGIWGSWYAVGAVCVAVVLCSSVGALALMVLVLAGYFVYRNLRSPWVLICIALIPAGYVGTRATGAISTDMVTQLGDVVFKESRVESLRTRLENEDILAVKAWERPVFGWGRFGRNRVKEDGRDIVITDGLWIIIFGQLGLVGIIALLGMYLAPIWAVLMRSSTRLLARPEGAAIVALCLIGTMHMLDSLFNAMLNPIFVLALGVIAGNLGLSTRFANQKVAQEQDDAASAVTQPAAIGHPHLDGPTPTPQQTGRDAT